MRELDFMVTEASRFAAELGEDKPNCDLDKLKAELEGRFLFLKGIYRAHSEVGDLFFSICFLNSAFAPFGIARNHTFFQGQYADAAP